MKYRKLRNFKLLRIWEEHICLIFHYNGIKLRGRNNIFCYFFVLFLLLCLKKRTFTAETQDFSKPSTASQRLLGHTAKALPLCNGNSCYSKQEVAQRTERSSKKSVSNRPTHTQQVRYEHIV